MGSLDEAKRQQYQKQIMARAAEKTADQLESIYRERIIPKMSTVHQAFTRLADKLNQSDTPAKANFFIEGFGRLENLIQQEYRVSVNHPENGNEVCLSFNCVAKGELGVYVEGNKNIEMLLELFKQNGLSYSSKPVKDDLGNITGEKLSLQRTIPVSFTFKSDIQNVSIELQIRNFESLGINTIQFSPESITDDFLNKLSDYIVRKNRGLFSLDLSEIERRRIRAKVMYEQQQRQAELDAADKRSLEQEPRKKSFFTRLMGK